ncbi:MAG: putative lipid II flippase FtsW [Candidatus Velthaea sp.]|jgi:cell division protein FtsW
MLGSTRAPARDRAPSGRGPLATPVSRRLAPADSVLFAAVAALVAIGLIMVYSASSATAYANFHDTAHYLKRQLLWLLVALVCAYFAYRIDYRKLRSVAPFGLGVAFILLIAVLIPHVGQSSGGSRRWLGTQALSFEPSEFAKLALVVFLAAKLSTMGERLRSLVRGVVPCLFVTCALAVPILLEPDMGTASLLVFAAFGMLFCAGARLEHLALCSLSMLPVVLLAIGSSAYKRARIFAFLDPWKDPQNTGFHIIQSLLALGSGGLAGVGLGASRQKFFYLPEQYTDFIFAILGEELGLLGALGVVALFLVFAFRAVRIALAAPDRFGMLLALGCTLVIVIQAFVNIGVVTSSWPVTGVPLPFVSFGGTSLVVSLVAVGLIINVGRHRHANASSF